NRMENEIQTLSRTVYKGEAPPPGSFSGGGSGDTEIRLQQLETELRETRGLIEEQNHQIRTMQERLDKALSDMELRLGEAERGGGGGPVYTQGSMTNYDTAPAPAESGYEYSSQGQL